MHINLGIPSWVDHSRFNGGIEQEEDIEVLASAFSLAFTSGFRLRYRFQSVVVMKKLADITSKNQGDQANRIEIKALEVKDSSTYRLFHELQLVSASSFAHLSSTGQYGLLALVWNNTKGKIMDVFSQYGVDSPVNFLSSNKEAVQTLVLETNISSRLRDILTGSSSQVRHLLNPA